MLKIEYEKLHDILMRANSDNTTYLKQQNILHSAGNKTNIGGGNNNNGYVRRY